MENLRQTVLIIDDTPANIKVLSELLGRQHEILFATSGKDGLKIAQKELPDLILLDVMMPGMDGYEVCRRLKEDPVTESIPVIFVTALGHESDETRGLQAGAIDYITKPVSPPIVRARVNNHLKLKRYQDILANQANIDGLTGIYNRRHFESSLKLEWQRCQRTGSFLSLMLLDIDFFKLYNDTYGHPAGDDCLKAVAKAIEKEMQRAGDTVARYGGEEFVCILSNTDEKGALSVGERILKSVSELDIPHEASSVAPFVTVSIGFCTTCPGELHTPAQLVSCADRNLYRAKQAGRNRIYVCRMSDCNLSCCTLENIE